MACRQQDIQELLPAFIEHSLAPDDERRVESHLALCVDCREETDLLRLMAAEPVPDPGEAFWSTMPERVHRRLQEEKAHPLSPGFSWRGLFSLSRLAWAAPAAVLIAVLAWFLFNPGQQSIQETDTFALDDNLIDQHLEVAELTEPEMTVVTQWAENEYAPIGEAFDEQELERTDHDISEDLSNLSPRELDQVLEQLKKREQDARDKTQKGKQENGVG